MQTEPGLSASSLRAPQPHLLSGVMLAAFGAVCFSGKAIIVKLAYRHGVDAVTLIMYRMLFALPLFALIAWWASRGRAALSRREWWMIVMLGFFGYYLASFLDFMGLQYVSASLERLILYLNPTLVLIVGAMLFRKRVRPRALLAMAVSYAGIALVFMQELRFEGSNVALGAALVFASAVSYAIYLVYSGEVVQGIGTLRLTGYASIIACLLCIAQFVLLRPMSAAAVPQPVIWLSLLNATLCTVAPVVMLMKAIEMIGAPLASQTGMIGPMSTILMGVLILGEPFNGLIIVGTVLVLAGVALSVRMKNIEKF
jgi:drug/metabolite transporter (DMT)-like permease